MFYEVLLLLSVSAIFVILARKYPQTTLSSRRGLGNRLESPVTSISQSEKLLSQMLGGVSEFIRGARSVPVGLIQKILGLFKPKARKIKIETKAENLVSEVARTPKSFKSELARADEFLLKGQAKQAEQLYLRLLKTRPRDGKLYSRIGIVYMKKGEYKNARKVFEIALRQNPKVSARYYNLALAYRGLGDFESAIAKVKRAQKLNPTKKYQALLKALQKQKNFAR